MLDYELMHDVCSYIWRGKVGNGNSVAARCKCVKAECWEWRHLITDLPGHDLHGAFTLSFVLGGKVSTVARPPPAERRRDLLALQLGAVSQCSSLVVRSVQSLQPLPGSGVKLSSVQCSI
jgi:hypothetical protein